MRECHNKRSIMKKIISVFALAIICSSLNAQINNFSKFSKTNTQSNNAIGVNKLQQAKRIGQRDSTTHGIYGTSGVYKNRITILTNHTDLPDFKISHKAILAEEPVRSPLGIGKFTKLSNVDPQSYIQEIEHNYKKDLDRAYNEGYAMGQDAYIQQESNRKNEHAYFLNVTKKNGWYIGVGKQLPENELVHIPSYYKLSLKNKKGNWTFMQAYNSYGSLATNHSIGTYLVNPNSEFDTNGNNDIVEQLKTVCQWMIVENEQTNTVAQELGLDYNGNIIYCYTPTKIAEGKYSGSYTDALGLPIYMRTDSLGNHEKHANFVQVTRDQWGYDSLLVFVDEKGYAKPNKDGAYQTKKIYNSNGMQILEASLNILGEPMNDLFSNCGWRNEYDEWGNHIKAEYFDADGNPYNGTLGSDMVYGYEFEYDKYHREIKRFFLDEFGKRTTNSLGVYTIEQEYDSHGNQTHCISLDADGHGIAGDTLGIAESYARWDDNGNLLSLKFYNKNKEYVNNSDGICSRELEYDKNDQIIHQIDYCIYNGNKTKQFEYQKNNNELTEIKVWYNDNLRRIDSLYTDGTTKCTEYYTLDSVSTESLGFHKYKRDFVNLPNKSVRIEEWFDKDGDYTSSEEEPDLYRFLRYRFGQKVSEDFSTILSQWDITPYGEQARVGWWNALHYKADVTYTLYGKLFSMVGKNEFDEPAYINTLDNDPDVYYYSNINGGKHIYYDEFGKEIESMSDFRNRLPRVHCIEVVDTLVAYPLGVRNGDIIISYGDWGIDESLNYNHKYLYLEEILKANEPKSMIVLRHYPSERRSQIINLSLPTGKPSELGFYPHTIYYTQKEVERLRKSVMEYGFAYLDDITGENPMILLNPIKGGLTSSKPYWLRGCQDPGIVVFAENCIDSDNDGIISNVDAQWDIQNNDGKDWYRSPVFAESYNGIKNIYYSTDLNTFNSQQIKGAGNEGLSTYLVWVNKATKEKLLKNYTESKDSVVYDSGEHFNWKTDCKGKLSLREFAEQVMRFKFGCGAVVKKGSELQKKLVSDNVDLTGVNYFMRWKIDESNNSNVYKLLKQLNISQFAEINEDKHGLSFSCRLQICSFNEGNANIEKILIIDNEEIVVFEGEVNKDNISDKIDELLKYTREYRDNHYTRYIKLKPRVDGMLSKMGYNGTYIVLKLNEWSQGKNIDLLSELIDSSNQVEKDLILVPIIESSYKIKFGKPLSIHCPVGSLVANFSNAIIPVEVAKKEKSLKVDFEGKIDSSIVGYWELQIEEKEADGSMLLNLRDDMTYHIDLQMQGVKQIHDSIPTTMIIQIGIDGKWNTSGNYITMTAYPEGHTINVDVLDVETGRREEILAYILPEIKEKQNDMITGMIDEGIVSGDKKYQLINECEFLLGDTKFQKIDETQDIVIGRIDGNEGYMPEHGYQGMYVVLEWCGWKIGQTIQEFEAEFTKQKEKPKHLVLLPVKSVNDEDVFDPILEVDIPEGLAGMRLTEQEISRNKYNYSILSRYKSFKKE